MSKKGENIYKRKDGRWEARYIKGYDEAGKIRYGFCYGKSYREAKEKLTQTKSALLCNALPPENAGRHRLAFFCREWLLLQKGRVKESTYVKYEGIVTRHLIPKLGGCLPAALNTSIAESFKRELLEEGLSAGTVKNILLILRAVLGHISKQLPGVLPAIEVRYPREPRREARVLSAEEQRRVVAYLRENMDECKFGVLLALLTGLRIGELCALRWENICLSRGTIRVDATMQRLKNRDSESKTKIVISGPKSDSSLRTIPLSKNAAALCKSAGARGPSAFVLTGEARYMEPRALQYRFKRYMRDCGLDGVHFHTLRHTFATRCVEAGFELKSLSEILGHASTSITMNRYVHSSLELKRDNMDKLAAVGL